jgi:glycosyltransferase involved in cell wall biosynthesis
MTDFEGDVLPRDTSGKRLLFIVNEGYFFLSHRLPVARAARAAGMEVHVAAPDDNVWAPEAFRLDELRQSGLIVHSYGLSRRGRNIFSELRSFLSIFWLLITVRPDILHLLTIKPVLYGGVAARLCGIPSVVFGITGLGQAFGKKVNGQTLLNKAVIRVYRFVTGHRNCRVIVQNNDDLRQLIDLGAVLKNKLVLIRGSGVSMAEFQPGPEPEGPSLLILPARLIWEKGVQEYVEAAIQLKTDGIEARFALIGDTQASNPRAVPASVIEKWVESGAIEWWGRRSDMPDVIAQAAVVVLPSFYGEGVPRILIEAAASGRPIVTTDSAGCREIVRDGINGLLVIPQDVDSLANAMKKLILSPDLRASFGQAGRQIAENEFSDILVSESTINVYRNLLN